MVQDYMRYDLLTQDALRNVVRLALQKVQRSGLPGEHHFFIAFNTQYPGVKLSPALMNRYPEEMTVVMQHQFWNLLITDTFFEVELSFDNVMEKLVIPFASIKGFFDPSVQFGLQFEIASSDEDTDTEAPNNEAAGDDNKPVLSNDIPPSTTTSTGLPPEPITASNDSATIVSLDAFRKK